MIAPTSPAAGPPLGSLSEEDRYARFDILQRRMPDVWRIMGLNQPGESVVVIPSVSLDRIGEGSGPSHRPSRSGSSSSSCCSGSLACG